MKEENYEEPLYDETNDRFDDDADETAPGLALKYSEKQKRDERKELTFAAKVLLAIAAAAGATFWFCFRFLS